ncbi:MAG: amidohydrolase family protein, partial [Deltaproteobacteria bacterium]|nr:amidohydrolase family protein [Deltaproteobacteria bacterium]
MARTIVALLNGLLYDPTQDPTQRGLGEPLDVHIRDGRVAAICPAGSPGPPGEGETVDLGGRMWILPGLVDMHVHLRVPGEEHKETLETGLRAAVVGGFSSVLAMPNVSPAIDDAARVRSALCQAQSVPGARLLQSAAMSLRRAGEELCEYAEIRAAGAVAVTDDGAWVSDGAVMRRVLEYAAVHDLLPLSHSEDMTLSKGGQIHEGRVSTRLGLKGIPPQAEEVAIYRDIALARLTG